MSSRVAKRPVALGKDVTAEVSAGSVTVKGPKGSLSLNLSQDVEVSHSSMSSFGYR